MGRIHKPKIETNPDDPYVGTGKGTSKIQLWGVQSEGLTPQEIDFVLHYISIHNAPESARRAGFASTMGAKLLAKANVVAEIERIESDILNEVGLTAYFVAANIKDILVNGKRDADRLKAIELAGRWRGLWRENATLHATQEILYTLDIPRPNGELESNEPQFESYTPEQMARWQREFPKSHKKAMKIWKNGGDARHLWRECYPDETPGVENSNAQIVGREGIKSRETRN